MSTESIKRSWYIRDSETSGTYRTKIEGNIGRVRVANSAENALKRYLNDSYNARRINSSTTLFVPKKSYEVFLLSDPVVIEVTPVQESPFTLEVTVSWERT
ncbi:hypothetical protein LCGC14_2680540 [marine sediment metagenome]|uniref:Uncharacterized protein n=1 Tax=marine sediment metagenome TaxID=412755 RepID=A0A0F9A907_9ZZZZ